MHLAVETVVQLEVTLLSKTTTSNMAWNENIYELVTSLAFVFVKKSKHKLTFSEYFYTMILTKTTIWIFLSSFEFGLFATDNL